MSRLIALFLVIILLTGCSSSNEDPTNIELEVLRASLLEKELLIDELHRSLDENTKQRLNIETQVEDLQKVAELEKSLKEKLLEGQNQILTIHDNKDNYFQFLKDDLYIITTHNDETYNYSYDELMRFRNKEKGQLIYRGNNLEFNVDTITNVISVLDVDRFRLFNYEGENTYTYEIDLNNPLIELNASLYIRPQRINEAYVTLWKYTDQDQATLYSVIYFDFENIYDVVTKQYYLKSQSYIFDNTNGKLIYEEILEDVHNLYELNLATGTKNLVIMNKTKSFELYTTNGNIYYYNENIKTFIRYDNDWNINKILVYCNVGL